MTEEIKTGDLVERKSQNPAGAGIVRKVEGHYLFVEWLKNHQERRILRQAVRKTTWG